MTKSNKKWWHFIYWFTPQGWIGDIWISANGTTYREYTIEEVLQAAKK